MPIPRVRFSVVAVSAGIQWQLGNQRGRALATDRPGNQAAAPLATVQPGTQPRRILLHYIARSLAHPPRPILGERRMQWRVATG